MYLENPGVFFVFLTAVVDSDVLVMPSHFLGKNVKIAIESCWKNDKLPCIFMWKTHIQRRTTHYCRPASAFFNCRLKIM